MDDFFDRTAAVGSDEEEEELDEETGEAVDPPKKSKQTNGEMDDSSEEEDEDDEEAEREVAEGFIDDEEEDPEARKERRRERKKRRREEREEDEGLDEEDLDLIGLSGPSGGQEQQSKYKRLKRGHREDRSTPVQRGVEDIFSDEEEAADGAGAGTARGRGAFGYGDDMDDFIEQDEFPDEERGQLEDDLGIQAPRKPGLDIQNLRNSGLDDADLEDMDRAFGNGEDFAWALEQEREMEGQNEDPDKPLELKDVFEPSQLKEKMLTDEDNRIRMRDVPERFQLARKPYKESSELTEVEIQERSNEEPRWVADMLFPKKRLAGNLREPFEAAVKTVLEFMNNQDYEPAFIFQNRKDYLIHSEKVPVSPDPERPDAPEYEMKADKLLSQNDLWDVFEQDLKFRAFQERRTGIRKSVQTLKDTIPDFSDVVFDELIPLAAQMDDIQDLQDYVNFQYSAQLQDATAAHAEAIGAQKRAKGARSVWEKVRSGPAYHVVRAFGITADQLAKNAAKTGDRTYTDDTDLRPDDLADTLVRDPDYRTGEDVLTAAKALYVEEIATSPRMRRHVRQLYYEHLVFDVHRTDKGLKQIDENHPYYEFKYLRDQTVRQFLVNRPELFLRMLKAESEGLIEVQVRLQNEKRIKADLQKAIMSDNMSDVADAWNALRKEVLDTAMDKLHRTISKGVKDNLKNECENKIAANCREAYCMRLDAAPFKPKGMSIGTTARVLALSNGEGKREDAICWAYMEENGRVLETGKFTNLKPGNPERYIEDGADTKPFIELVERRKPDIVAVSGWSVEARRLLEDLRAIVAKFELKGTPAEDDDGNDITDNLEVVMANDEVARLYYNSNRAVTDHPGVPALTRYAIALCRYLQDPLKEYAALGRDIISISFDPNQNLIPEEKLMKWLDTAMVDMVNMCGVDLQRAVAEPYIANLLPYVCGLGPRKAARVIKAINSWGGEVISREELVGDIDAHRQQAVGPKIWTNSASFLYMEYDETEGSSDYLDNTRIHPEDYDIARKMAADAQEMDEEDIKVETDENGPMAVVRKLIKEEAQEKVNDLMLEQYAVQLESQFAQKKRATLETIREELQAPYEELRRLFETPSTDEVFTMLTGETDDTLKPGMIVPVSIKKTSATKMEVKLDCGIDGEVSSPEYPEDVVKNSLDPRQIWSPHQTIQAKIMYLDKKKLTAQLSLRERELRDPYRPVFHHHADEWDEELEAKDKKDAKKALEASGATRAQRVIKHPLFRPFNSRDAEAFLQPQNRGDCVIRPSSKGPDHLAVTWKVHENLYQHLDVLELDKENEFSVGRVLRVGGKYSYSDLDELIVLHVRAMAKKVDEMMGDERYQNGTKAQTGESALFFSLSRTTGKKLQLWSAGTDF